MKNLHDMLRKTYNIVENPKHGVQSAKGVAEQHEYQRELKAFHEFEKNYLHRRGNRGSSVGFLNTMRKK